MPSPPPPTTSATATAPAVSRWAIAALACSVVVCCPPASALGIGLAIVAVLRIGRSDVPLRGRGMAIAAMAIGAAGLIGQTFAIQWHDEVFRARIEAAMIDELTTAIQSSSAGDIGVVRRLWSENADVPSEASIRSFGTALQERYGSFRTVTVVRWQPGGSLMSPTIEVALTAEFDARTLVGAAEFEMLPAQGLTNPPVRLRSLDLEDSRLGDLSLPAVGR